jgi:hypothetical protein
MPHYTHVLGISPEERHQIYKKLRLEVLAYPDKSLEVSGAILAVVAENDGGGQGALEPTRTS